MMLQVESGMIDQHPILGGLVMLAGLIVISFNKEGAQHFAEQQRALKSWGMRGNAYEFGRGLSIILGSLLAVLGALMAEGFSFSK
jgi:hypothetical protein